MTLLCVAGVPLICGVMCMGCPVRLQLLELSALCLRCEVGDLLDDESCWNIFLACYDLYHVTTDERASGLLRDTASNTLAHVVLMLFNCPRVPRSRVKSSAANGVDVVDASARRGSSGIGPSADSPGGRPDGTNPQSNRAPEHAMGDPSSADEQRPNGGDQVPRIWRTARKEYEDASGGGAVADRRPRSVMFGPTRVVHEDAEDEPWPSIDGEGDVPRGMDGVSVDSSLRPAGSAANEEVTNGQKTQTVLNQADDGRGEADAGTSVATETDGVVDVDGDSREVGDGEHEGVLVNVMRFLSRLSDPRSNSSADCVLGLSLINIALEAGGAGLGRIPALVNVMRGDLCKHLLQNSQTADLNVLSLTLRVVFNLFNSIKDHLKIQLEVFLTR